MKKLKKLLAMAMTMFILIPFVPIPVYGDKIQVAVGSEDIDILFTAESQKDITMLYPMEIININEAVSISKEQIKKLLSGDIECTLPHMVMYQNVDSKATIDANQSSPTKYREAVTWLSKNNKLHLPEEVTFSYTPMKIALNASGQGKTPSDLLYTESETPQKTFPFNKGKYRFNFRVTSGPAGDVRLEKNGVVIFSRNKVNEANYSFELDDRATITVYVKEYTVVNSKGESETTEWKYDFYIEPDVDYPVTAFASNVNELVDYKIDYKNIYKSHADSMSKSVFVMNLLKSIDEVQYSRPLLVNSAYTKKINAYTEQQVSTEPLEQSLFAKYASEAGVDFSNSQMMNDYTHFGTRLMFTTPNVPELYISRALDKGIVKPGELNPTSEVIRPLYAKYADVIPAYSPEAFPARSNYPSSYDPMGIISGTIMASSRLDALYRVQLIPENLNFEMLLTGKSYQGKPVTNTSIFGQGYTYTDRPNITSADYLQNLVINTDNLRDYVSSSSTMKQLINNLPKANTSKPFENTVNRVTQITAQNPNDVQYFLNEKLTYIDAIRIAYEGIQVYSEPTLTQLEIDAVNSLFGVQLNNVSEEDKKILEYMFAKGILNPEESTIIDLYQPLTNELGLGLIYRIANPNARYTVKTNISVTDKQLLDKGFSQIEAEKSSTNTNIVSPKAVDLENNDLVYIRLEELYLKDVDGRAYETGAQNTSPNLDYRPSEYSIENNLFGLYGAEYNKSLRIYNPNESPYYLGKIELTYKSSHDGENRKVIWLKYNMPDNFTVGGDITFNSAGNGDELPSVVNGISGKPGFYYVPHQDKLSYLGQGENFNLRIYRNKNEVNIASRGALTARWTDRPIKTGHIYDQEDIYQLWKYLYPNSALRFEQGKYDPYTQPQTGSTPTGDDTDFIQSISKLNKLPFVMSLQAAEDEAPVKDLTTTTNTSTPTHTRTASNEYAFYIDGITKVKLKNLQLFLSNGTTASLNPEAVTELKRQYDIKVEDITPPDVTNMKRVMFSSTMPAVNLTAFIDSSLKVAIPTDGSPLPIGMLYFKFDDGNGMRTLIPEAALAKFDIKVYKDKDSNTKVLQNTKTGVYGILSDGTNTCIIGNEFMHFPESVGMLEITDSGTYYNFDIIKKMINYGNISTIDTEIDANSLKVIENKALKAVDAGNMYYNGVKTDVFPNLYQENNDYYLNLNSLGYGAGYIMKTWTTKDNMEYTLLTEFKYEKLDDKMTTGNIVPVSQGHTLDKSQYARYKDLINEHFTSIFTKNEEAMKRLALSNLAVHWTLYNAKHLPTTIKTNYVTNPYAVTKFTLFKNGVRVSPQEETEAINQIYAEMDSISEIVNFGSELREGANLKIKDSLKEKYLEGTFTADLRQFVYDKYKKSICVKLAQTTATPVTLGEVKLIHSISQDNKHTVKLFAQENYVGFDFKQIPLYAEMHSWGNANKAYSLGGKIYRANGPELLVDSKNVQYVYIGLAGEPVQISLPLKSLKTDLDADELEKALPNGALFAGFSSPYAEYPYTKDAIIKNEVPFLSGDVDAKELKLKFINYIGNTSNFELNVGKDSNKILLVRYSNNVLRPHYYYEVLSNGKVSISRNPLTEDQVKAAKSNSASVYIQYNYLVGITDLVYDKDSNAENTTKSLVFSKPKVYYTERISPILDINTVIAKDLLAAKTMDSYINNKEGTTTTVSSNAMYLANLKEGDILLLGQYSTLKFNDIAVVSKKPEKNKYVPITTLFAGTDKNNYSPIDVLISGRTNILVSQILNSGFYLPGAVYMPLAKVTDMSSIQIADSTDVFNFMKFYVSALKPEPKETTTDYKSIFSSSNMTLRNTIRSALSSVFNEEQLKFLVQDGEEAKVFTYNPKNPEWSFKPKLSKISERDFDKSNYDYFARFDIYPYIQVEWVADFSVSAHGQTRSIYRIIDVNTASGQNAGAYADYSNYLRKDFNTLKGLTGKQQLWDKYFLSAKMLTSDDLDAYINSQTPELDRELNNAKNSRFWASMTFSQLLLLIEVILLLLGILAITTYALCSFPIGRLIIHKLKYLEFLSRGKQTPYNVDWKRYILYSIAYIGVVTIVFYSGTWSLLVSAYNAIISIGKDITSYFDAIMRSH